MVEDWIDQLTKTWATVNLAGSSGAFAGQQVRSFNLVTDNDFPEAINPEDIASRGPIALTFPPSLRPMYSLGGPRTATWSGVTEFHLAPDMAKSRIRALLPYYKAIWNAAAGTPTLGNRVELFQVANEDEGLSALEGIQYGDETPHWGILVKWWVKEHVESVITVGGPGT